MVGREWRILKIVLFDLSLTLARFWVGFENQVNFVEAERGENDEENVNEACGGGRKSKRKSLEKD